jgi:hypothetical protein
VEINVIENEITKYLLNNIVSWFKSIGTEKWEALRRLPYFEGWLQCEIASFIKANPSPMYSLKGFDPPVYTQKPIPGRKTWYPDLLLYSETIQTFVWLELKAISLARKLVKKEITLSRYRNKISETWHALNGLSLEETFSRWEKHKLDQQLISLGNDVSDLIDKARKTRHFIAMLIVVTGLKEASEVLPATIKKMRQNVEIYSSTGFKVDYLILLGKLICDPFTGGPYGNRA